MEFCPGDIGLLTKLTEEKKLLHDRYSVLPYPGAKRWQAVRMKSAGCSWER